MNQTTMTTPRTIGMQIDDLIAHLESLPSTQLYALIVAATVSVCYLLLGTGMNNNNSVVDSVPLKPMKSTSNSSTYPQPKWQYFHYFNCAVVGAFGWSVATFCWNATTIVENSAQLMQFIIGWCVCLCYFFGFFGVSFVHDIAPTTTNTTEHQTAPNTSTAAPRTAAMPPKKQPKKVVPEPPCAPYKKSTPLSKDELKSKVKGLNDDEISQLVLEGQMKDHELEKLLDCSRAVDVRRIIAEKNLTRLGHVNALEKLPSTPSLDYGKVHGANCEIVVGYVPLPVGLVGPLSLNDEVFYVPMATTEGCLVASTNRGAKAITQGGGATAEIVRDGITRAPCVRMSSAQEAAYLKRWCEEPTNFAKLKAAFESTTSFGKLLNCAPTVAGRNCYLRLQCFSGDAMGMNMVSKGSLAVIETLQAEFPSLQLVALSGNMCTDKKAAAMNWIEGRGKSVVVEATIPKDVVHKTLKTTVPAIIETNLHKNLIGSAMAGAVGGFNCHASNIVTAVFLATGQDPAQNVESSNCITLLEETSDGDLWVSCTMPSIEVGTVGGGTSLAAQAACLQAIGVKGGGETPGANAKKLATVVAAMTMAGELSLLAALASNTLVAAHMQHNRKPVSSSTSK